MQMLRMFPELVERERGWRWDWRVWRKVEADRVKDKTLHTPPGPD